MNIWRVFRENLFHNSSNRFTAAPARRIFPKAHPDAHGCGEVSGSDLDHRVCRSFARKADSNEIALGPERFPATICPACCLTKPYSSQNAFKDDPRLSPMVGRTGPHVRSLTAKCQTFSALPCGSRSCARCGISGTLRPTFVPFRSDRWRHRPRGSRIGRGPAKTPETRCLFATLKARITAPISWSAMKFSPRSAFRQSFRQVTADSMESTGQLSRRV